MGRIALCCFQPSRRFIGSQGPHDEKVPMPKLTLSRYLNSLPVLMLTVVFGWAAWERLRLPLTPLVDPDVWAYLGPGLGALVGERFREWFGQCFLYPWFLYILLRVGGSFRWITLIQGLLGLGTGALLFACWMELRRFLPAPRLPALVFKLLGAELVGVYLFSTATIQFERTLRPEAVFPFVVILQIYCNLLFLRARFFDGQPGRTLLSGGLAVFLSVAAWLLKPSFAGALLPANLPVIVALFRAGQPVWSKFLLVTVPVAAAALLLIWPESEFRQRDPAGSRYLSQSLFSIHADLINKQMGEDLARHAVTPYPPQFLATTYAALTEALRESRGKNGKYWPALGFNGDYLRFGSAGKPPFLQDLTSRLGGEHQSAEFCRYYYWRTMRGQPAGMALKIARQLAVFYSPRGCPAYVTYASFSLAEQYQRTTSCLLSEPRLQRYSPGASMLATAATLTNSPLQVGPYKVTAWINRFLAKTHICACFWAVLLTVLALRKSNLSAFRTLAPILLLLYGYSFGTVLTLAIGHSLDVGRYSQYQFAYTLLPDFVSIWLAIEAFVLAADCWHHRV
jgi:hypothetical protein